MARTWRAERKTKAQGDYFVLVTGRARDRVSISLKYLSEADAQSALGCIQREEEAGTVSSVIQLHQEDPDSAIRYLVGDPGLADLLPAPATDYGAMTLANYWEEVYKPWRSADRPKTWRTEKGHWVRILREIGSVRLRKVDAHLLADYVDGMLVERKEHARLGEPMSGAIKRLHRNAVQALLNHADRQRHLPGHVNLGRFRIRGSTVRALPQVDPLSLDELVRLMDVSSPKHRAMWAVGVGEGLRPSELERLQWHHVHWDDRTLDVPGEKTEASADTVPLTPIAHRELHAWWTEQKKPTEGYCFPADSSGRPYRGISGYKRALSTAAVKAELGRAITPYLLRHSFATLAWSLGIDKDVARRIGRWTDMAMLDRVYTRPRPADLVGRVAAFDVPKKE